MSYNTAINNGIHESSKTLIFYCSGKHSIFEADQLAIQVRPSRIGHSHYQGLYASVHFLHQHL